MAIIMEYLNDSKVVCTGDCSRRLTGREREREKEQYDYYLDTIKILIDGFFDGYPSQSMNRLRIIFLIIKKKVISCFKLLFRAI